MSEQQQQQDHVPDIFTGEPEPTEQITIVKGAEPPVPADPKPAEPVPPPPDHPKSLVRLARDLGISEASIAQLTTAQLDSLVGDFAARPRSPEPPPEPKPEEITFADLQLGDNPDTGKPYVEDDFDPGFVRFMKAQLKETRELRRELEQQTKASQQGREVELIDAAFAQVGNAEAFGEGGIAALTDDEARMRRNAAVQIAVQMAGDNPTVERIAAALPKAAETLFGKPKAKAPEPGYDLQQRREQWQKGALAQPTHRQIADLPPGEERARLAVKAELERHGVEGSTEPTTLNEFL